MKNKYLLYLIGMYLIGACLLLFPFSAKCQTVEDSFVYHRDIAAHTLYSPLKPPFAKLRSKDSDDTPLLSVEGALTPEGFKFFGSDNDAIQKGLGVQLGVGFFSRLYVQGEFSAFATESFNAKTPVTYLDSSQTKILNANPNLDTQTQLTRLGCYLKYIIAPPSKRKSNQIYLLVGLDALQISYQYPNINKDLSSYPLIQNNIRHIDGRPYNPTGTTQQLNGIALGAGAGVEFMLLRWIGLFGELRGSYPLGSRSDDYQTLEIKPNIRLNIGARIRLNLI